MKLAKEIVLQFNNDLADYKSVQAWVSFEVFLLESLFTPLAKTCSNLKCKVPPLTLFLQS